MKTLIAANWKMNPRTLTEAKDLARGIVAPNGDVEVVFFPPCLYLASLCEAFPHLMWGAQNVHWEAEGAFTGEHSVGMIRDAGAHYVLIGHSERRAMFGETDGMVAKKAQVALSKGFNVILAVGESIKGESSAQVVESLKRSTEGVSAQDLSRLTVAYEPVWAISTTNDSQAASPDYVEKVVANLKSILDVRYIFGGSVDAENAKTYLSCECVNGVLVGASSLRADAFSSIIKQASNV